MRLYTINATPVRVSNSDKLNNTPVDKYPRRVSEILASNGINGFTIEKVQGYWQGVPEISYKIGIATDGIDDIMSICNTLKDVFNQEAVMLTYPDNSVELL